MIHSLLTQFLCCSCPNPISHEYMLQREDVSATILEIIKAGTPIVLALLAGFLALYQMKANVISSARIKWMEELRAALSEYYATVMDVVSYSNEHIRAREMKLQKEERDFYNKYSDSMTKFNILTNKIHMLLNRHEPKHLNIENILNELDGSFLVLTEKEISHEKQAEIEGKLKTIVSISKEIFREEWGRSKKLYRI